jgi:hypothetical protein
MPKFFFKFWAVLLAAVVSITNGQLSEFEPHTHLNLMCINPVYPCYYFLCSQTNNRGLNDPPIQTFRCAKGLVFSEKQQRCIWTLPWKSCEYMKTEQQAFVGMSRGLVKPNEDSTTRLMKIPRRFSFISTISSIPITTTTAKTTTTTTSTTTSTTTTSTSALRSTSKLEPRVIKSIEYQELFDESEFKPRNMPLKAKTFKREEEEATFEETTTSTVSDEDLIEDSKPAEEAEIKKENDTREEVANSTQETRVESGHDDDFNVTLDNNLHAVETSQMGDQYAYIIVPIKLSGTNNLPPNFSKKLQGGKDQAKKKTKEGVRNSSLTNLDGKNRFLLF